MKQFSMASAAMMVGLGSTSACGVASYQDGSSGGGAIGHMTKGQGHVDSAGGDRTDQGS